LKQWGLQGNALTISAFVFGLLFGIAYRYSVQPMDTFSGWFGAVVFGLLAGFTATRSYDGIQSASGKVDLTEMQTFTAEYIGETPQAEDCRE
jgi:hypothetical protein